MPRHWVASKRLKPRLYVVFGLRCLPSDLQDVFWPRINRLTPNLAEHKQQRRHDFRTIGGSGNPRGPYDSSRQRARFSAEFIAALRRDFQQGGPAAIAKVRKYQPAAYMKICALLVPRELQVEHSGGVKSMTDEQLEAAVEAIKAMLAAREAKTINGEAQPVEALPAPHVVPDDKAKRPNKVMDAADTAVGARERKPRKRMPSPTGG